VPDDLIVLAVGLACVPTWLTVTLAGAAVLATAGTAWVWSR
jgi:hypothetical protein